LGLSTKLLADVRQPAHATRLEEANCESVKVSQDSQDLYVRYVPYLTLLTCLETSDGERVRRLAREREHNGDDHVLEGIMISPNYGLFPEASRIKPTTHKICASLFGCGRRCRLLIWRSGSLGALRDVIWGRGVSKCSLQFLVRSVC
jgi:hypothetical protein